MNDEENSMLTPEEFVQKIMNVSHADKLRMAEIALENQFQTLRCLMNDHRGAVYFAKNHRCINSSQTGRRQNKLLKSFRHW